MRPSKASRSAAALTVLAVAVLLGATPRLAHSMGLSTYGTGQPGWAYSVDVQCPYLALAWADLQPARHEYRFTSTCLFAEKGGGWKEGVVAVTIQALWKGGEKRAWEKVLVSGDWTGHIDTEWSCPSDPFVAAVACARKALSTNLHPAVADRPAPFAANGTTPAKAAQADAAGDAAKKAKLEAAASLLKGIMPYAKIDSPQQGKTYVGGLAIKVRPQNISKSQWFAQCCEVELARSSSTGQEPSGPWAPAIVYADRNDVLTPSGWIIADGALEAGWWRVRARGCCLTDPKTGVGTHWPWSPWREFRVLLKIKPIKP
jgi:hypothetical protein